MLSAIEISAVFDGKTEVHSGPGESSSRACLYCQRYLQQYAELIGTYNAYRVGKIHPDRWLFSVFRYAEPNPWQSSMFAQRKLIGQLQA